MCRYLGQVLDSEDRTTEAEASMRRGIELLRQELSEMGEEETAAAAAGDTNVDDDDDDSAAAEEMVETREHLREGLSSALCSLAELLMGAAAEAAAAAAEGDLDSAAAALTSSPALDECEQLLGEARELWPRSPEPLQALCSLRRLQSREDDALGMLRQSLALWYKPNSGSSSSSEDGDDDDEGVIEKKEVKPEKQKNTAAAAIDMEQQDVDEEEEDDDDNRSIPSYEFRFEAAKLLIEWEETRATAADVLEMLLQENDTVPDVWLMLAEAYRAGGELEAAADAAREGAATARKLGYPGDNEVVAALGELEAELMGGVADVMKPPVVVGDGGEEK